MKHLQQPLSELFQKSNNEMKKTGAPILIRARDAPGYTGDGGAQSSSAKSSSKGASPQRWVRHPLSPVDTISRFLDCDDMCVCVPIPDIWLRVLTLPSCFFGSPVGVHEDADIQIRAKYERRRHRAAKTHGTRMIAVGHRHPSLPREISATQCPLRRSGAAPRWKM